MKKIVITGMGAVTPIGIGVDEYWKNLLDGKSGIDKITSFDPSELAVQFAGEIKNLNPANSKTNRPIYAVCFYCSRRSSKNE